MNDESPGAMRKASNRNTLICSFNWELFYQRFQQTKEEDLWKTMCDYLLSSINLPIEPENLKIQKFDSKSSKIKAYSLYIVRLPEYQLT